MCKCQNDIPHLPKSTTDDDTTFCILQRLAYLSDLTFLSGDTLNSWPFCKQLGHHHQAGACRTGAACEGGTGQQADLFADTNCSLFRLNWIGMSRLPGKGLIGFSKPAYLTQSSFISSFLWAGSPQVLEVCWLYQYKVLHLEFAYQCDVAVLSIVPICHHCYMKCLVGTSRFDKTK